MQATIALSRICGADEEDEKPTIIDMLEETVQYDPSAYVLSVGTFFLSRNIYVTTVRFAVQPCYISLSDPLHTQPS